LGVLLHTYRIAVAGTNVPPVNTGEIDIYLSVDGGKTFDFDHPLAAATPNDGSEVVFLSASPTNIARIMVRAANGIFSDISDQNFSIEGMELHRAILVLEVLTGMDTEEEILPKVDINYNGIIDIGDALIYMQKAAGL